MRTLRQTRGLRREGFTLIELMVVIAIIAIVAGLVSAAVFKYMGKKDLLNVTNDISQLETDLVNFKQKFGFYPPSKLFLSNRLARYSANSAQIPLAFRQQ